MVMAFPGGSGGGGSGGIHEESEEWLDVIARITALEERLEQVESQMEVSE